MIDQCDQALMQGPFLWAAKPHPRCLLWQRSWTGAKVRGQHDGYMRLDDPVTHEREIELDGDSRTIHVTDEILASGGHQVEVCFHLGENCTVERIAGGEFMIDAGPGKVKLVMDRRLNVEVLAGRSETLDGWVSRGYHRKAASTTLIGRCEIDGPAAFTTMIEVGLPASEMQQLSEQMPETSTCGDPL